jgi:hypothetical protein
VDAARELVAAQQVAQHRELHRLPQHQARQHDHDDVEHHEQVGQRCTLL